MNRIIIELLLQCIEWLCNTFLHLLSRKKLSRSAGKMRSYVKILLIPAWPNSRSAVDKISVRRETFSSYELNFFVDENYITADLVVIISPPRRDNFTHMNSPLDGVKFNGLSSSRYATSYKIHQFWIIFEFTQIFRICTINATSNNWRVKLW